MRALKKTLILLLLGLCQTVSAFSGEVVAVKSHHFKAYSQTLEGFKSACAADVTELTISETGASNVLRKIRNLRPSLILAVGRDALSLVKEIRDLPIVYTMVLNPGSVVIDEKNITGVNMHISPTVQLQKLLTTIPWAKRVGLVYDPHKMGSWMEEARFTARSQGVDLIVREVESPREVPSAIKSLGGKIDVYWMLPDVTVISPLTVEFLLLFSFENKIPIFTFSEKFVEKGALMSLNIDKVDLGRQAGEMAKKILAGTSVRDVPRSDAGKAVFSINLKVAKKMGIPVENDLIKTARSGNDILQFKENL